jgi:voltage-gated potassium channel
MNPPSPATLPSPLDLNAALSALARYWPQSTKIDEFSAKLAQRPAQNTLIILGLGAALFYYAERNENPKVNTIYDALEYCSSSLSVGYTSIYPQTPLGKLVATLLMTYGPALSNAVLDGPQSSEHSQHATEEQFAATQQKILATLEQILAQLGARPLT